MKFVDGKLCAFIVPKLIMEMIVKEAKRDTGNLKKKLENHVTEINRVI